MVSTRGIKVKFYEGERVLCYEPDPTKAKVLYDSKVLDIVINKDHRGRKTIEYLIHFQGWNSSWDRCVAEEFVLKDTAENRQLQKDLAEKSQLQLKERKKSRKSGEQVSASEDGSSGSPGRMDSMDTDGGQGVTSSSEDSSTEDETIHIEITPELRLLLENDYHLIKEQNKLMKLPADPNIVTILESYYRHYATNQICGLSEKPTGRYRLPLANPNHMRPKPEDILKNLGVCREVMDGLRIYFDFTFDTLLLYKPEVNQIPTKQAIFDSLIVEEMKQEIKSEDELNNMGNCLSNGNYSCQNGIETGISERRRTLRSNRSDSQPNGNASPNENCPSNATKPASSVTSSNSDITGPIAKTLSWRLLPEHVYHQQPPPPSMVYGATHLTRLLVKLPELLAATIISDEKLKVLLAHIDLFIDYLNEHKEWYGAEHYSDIF